MKVLLFIEKIPLSSELYQLLENRLPKRHQGSNPCVSAKAKPLKPLSFKGFCLPGFFKMTPKNAEFFPAFLSFTLKMARILERTFMIRAVLKSLKTTDITGFV